MAAPTAPQRRTEACRALQGVDSSLAASRYQLLHRSRRCPSFVVGSCICRSITTSRAIARCQSLYQLFHRPHHRIRRSIACSQPLYLSSRRSGSRHYVSRFIARGQLLYHWFHSSHSVGVSVCFIACGRSFVSVVPSRSSQSVAVSVEPSLETLYQSFHRSRSGVVSVVPSFEVSCFISRSIARGRALYQSFHCSLPAVVSVVPLLTVGSCIVRSRALYQLFHRLQSIIVSVVPSLVACVCICRPVAQALCVISVVPAESYQSFHRSRAVVVPLVP